jgi:hypothetical protein
MAYFERITAGTPVTLCPGFVGGGPEDVAARAVAYYDQGAEGLLFWDASGVAPYPARWWLVSRLGHVEEARERSQEAMPLPITLGLRQWGDFFFGRWSGGAGF